ncbi:2Fe-2S iron-sulfur cluster-binding protein [Rhodococcus sp. IEGM 1305]|uniref:2Fe-2S iron-sulfur cluster-binding protein n=1 Tax=unclassified Rhodococcus (in: high G+C Gram-positive bacteria) TaxID=192944 RepID=UPI001225269D|nr:2Fe-2S iron-sulfur cluster-binding protein [Rhodococcus sp. IEGM 1305]MDI9948936.1 2Fe-2S iron-sulfur cluster-binding protein [Rhodococcus sp. IEGM 1305]NDV06107.1 2Fe-2S iron-sulfur cluster binding domain-containing protein [Rhodococcus sp. IEGM 248]NHU42227.1 2Fe-2S iron-sulfur cluster binding domain-containing protein [Rhodococcus sp. A14]RZK82363.1 MAG: 2Fe-2S iron-sulfur cluster binding domain-containing protein [Rhodococcus sp. (in: high G+C Gram-positive bacteria)]
MSKVTFHQPDGRSDVLDVPDGTSLMRAAVTNSIPGIVGECGGQAMCATCHVYIRSAHLTDLPDVGEDEDEMLDCTATARDPQRSRLGCQILVTTTLDGLEVDLPESQI